MIEHLPVTTLSALADGELSAEQMARVKEHLDQCPACTSQALSNALLKTATADAGQCHPIPPQFQNNCTKLIARKPESAHSRSQNVRWNWAGITGWAVSVVLLAILAAPVYLNFGFSIPGGNKREQAALTAEISDLHIATLAASQGPQVLSSDRHTVKPWLEGKIPFSFNLPDPLPAGTQLDGANLAYLHGQPVAQLLYRIGQHRVSVFVRERNSEAARSALPPEHAGFQIAGFETPEIDVIAISDVERARLLALVNAIEQAQTNATGGNPAGR